MDQEKRRIGEHGSILQAGEGGTVLLKKVTEHKKYLQIFAWAVVAVAIICSFTLWGQRLAAEKAYDKVQVSVNYTDLVSMANANSLSNGQMAALLQDRGVSATLFKETSVGDLVRQGKVSLQLGYNLEQADFKDLVSTDLEINDATLFVCVLDQGLTQQVAEHLQAKVSGAQYYAGAVGVVAVPITIPSTDSEREGVYRVVTEIGVGFDRAGMADMASVHMGIIPQVRTWEDPSDASLRFVTDELKAIPNLSQILFNDKELPGAKEPKTLRTLAELLKVDGKAIAPIGTIEFSEQEGLNQLGILLDKEVIRLHTIANNEMSKLTMDDAMDRWMLAARERNMRSLLVRFVDINAPSSSLKDNLAYLETLQSGLTQAGFDLQGAYEKPKSIEADNLVILLIGLGVAAGVMLILLNMGLPRLSVAAFVVVALCWLGLHQLAPILARKLMALASVITFPTLSCLLMMRPGGKSLGKAIVKVLLMSALSFIGAILMVGLLADVLFMLKLDQFTGVKLAHIVPIVVVPLILYIWKDANPVQTIKELLAKAITYKWGLLAGILVVAGVVYISRTGNTTAQLSPLEALMRDFLNDVMGVRPRSKEFLIGYPFAVLLFYFGASKKNWILTIPAIIGQVSLVNTYAHIHTALLMSLQRSLNGLVLGLILGVLAVGAVKVGMKVWRILEKQSEQKNLE